MRSLLLLALALLSSVAGAVPAAATQNPSPQARAVDAYDELYAVMHDPKNYTVMVENILDTTLELMLRDYPEVAEMENESPGVVEDFRTAMRPLMMEQAHRTDETYRPRVIAVLRETLTPAEALAAADYYRSDLGQKHLDMGARSFSATKSMQGAMADPDGAITEADLASDKREAQIDAYNGLSAKERTAIREAVRTIPALAKLIAARHRIDAIDYEMAQVPLTAEEEARINEAVMGVIEKHFGPLEETLD